MYTHSKTITTLPECTNVELELTNQSATFFIWTGSLVICRDFPNEHLHFALRWAHKLNMCNCCCVVYIDLSKIVPGAKKFNWFETCIE